MAPVDSGEGRESGKNHGKGGPGLKLSVQVQLSVSMMASCGAEKSKAPVDDVVYPIDIKTKEWKPQKVRVIKLK